MKRIPLSEGKYALVDDEDFEYLNQWKWHINWKGYALRQRKFGVTRMHRLIMNTPVGTQTDHINNNKLDNRKCNLRICNNSQNHMNAPKRKDNTSGYKGISWSKCAKKWHAYINVREKRIYLGIHDSLKEAIKIREEATLKYHREFAKFI